MTDRSKKPPKAHVPGLSQMHTPGEPVRLSDADMRDLTKQGLQNKVFRDHILKAAGVLNAQGKLNPSFAKK